MNTYDIAYIKSVSVPQLKHSDTVQSETLAGAVLIAEHRHGLHNIILIEKRPPHHV